MARRCSVSVPCAAMRLRSTSWIFTDCAMGWTSESMACWRCSRSALDRSWNCSKWVRASVRKASLFELSAACDSESNVSFRCASASASSRSLPAAYSRSRSISASRRTTVLSSAARRSLSSAMVISNSPSRWSPYAVPRLSRGGLLQVRDRGGGTHPLTLGANTEHEHADRRCRKSGDGCEDGTRHERHMGTKEIPAGTALTGENSRTWKVLSRM